MLHQKLISSHLVVGKDDLQGSEIGLKIDQALVARTLQENIRYSWN